MILLKSRWIRSLLILSFINSSSLVASLGSAIGSTPIDVVRVSCQIYSAQR